MDVNRSRQHAKSELELEVVIWHAGHAIRKDPRIDRFGSSAFFQSQSCHRHNAQQVMLPTLLQHDSTTLGTAQNSVEWIDHKMCALMVSCTQALHEPGSFVR